MARRRFGFAPKPAPKPIKTVKPVVDLDGLRQAYEWMPVSKEASFKLAFDWYNANLTALLFGDPLDEARQKHYSRAIKSKSQGDHTTFEGERYTAWTTAIKFYERVWPAHNLPTIETAIAAAEMGSAPSRRVANVQTVLNMLNAAYAGLVTFRMTFGSEREADGNEVLLPIADIAAMIPLTPLKCALRELPTVAKLLSIVTDEATGQQSLDGGVFMTTLPTLLDKVSDWASVGDLARKTVGKAIATPRTARTATAKAPRTQGAARAPRSKTNNTQVIHLVPNVIQPTLRGIRSKIASLLHNGDTIAQYQAKVVASIPGKHTWDAKTVLEAYVAAGAAKLA